MGFNAQAQTGRGIPVDGFCGCAVPQPRQRPPPRPLQLPVTSAVEELCYLAFGDPFRVGNRLNENNEGQRVGCGENTPPGIWNPRLLKVLFFPLGGNVPKLSSAAFGVPELSPSQLIGLLV